MKIRSYVPLAVIFVLASAAVAIAGEPLEVDVQKCIRLEMSSQKIIKNAAELLSEAGHGPSQSRCMETLLGLNIDFTKHYLVGVSIVSGHCVRPPELKAGISTDQSLLRYLVNVTYEDTTGICKAIRPYDLWLLVPVPDPGYTLEIRSGTESAPVAGSRCL